ncbi:MAG: hypothetical protein JO086_01240 [Acidimicrobiia bacterium]|nr:hypothetical protein [Acidimicrobiia bacterium]
MRPSFHLSNRRTALAALATALVVGACSSGGANHASTSSAGAGAGAGAATATTTAAPGRQAVVRATLAGWRLPAPLSRPAVAVADGRIFLLGGLAAGDVSTPRVVSVDPATGQSSVAGTLAVAVHDAAGAAVGGVPTVFGGGGARTIDAVQAFQAGAGHVTAHLPRPRSDLASASGDGSAFVVGGFDGGALTPDVLATTDATHFRTVARLSQGVRYAAVAAVGHSLWVIGGQTGTAEGATGTEVDLIQRVDIDSGQSMVVGHLPHRLAHAMAFVLGGELYLAGGRTATAPLTDVLAISGDGTAAPVGNLPGPRADAGVAVVGDTAWLLGGETTGPAAALASVVAVSRSGG